MRPGLWREAAPHAWRLHAAVLGHPSHHVHLPLAGLPVRGAHPSSVQAGRGYRGARREVLPVHDPSALRLRAQLPHIQVPAGPEQGHGHGGGGGDRPRVPCLLKLASDSPVQARPRRCGNLTQHSLVDRGACTVRLHCHGLLPWCLEWLQLGGFQGIRIIRLALNRICNYAVVSKPLIFNALHQVVAISIMLHFSSTIFSLEFWYYMIIIVLVGRLENAQIAVAAVSIW